MTDRRGQTPLMLACARGQRDIANVLLAAEWGEEWMELACAFGALGFKVPSLGFRVGSVIPESTIRVILNEEPVLRYCKT